MRKVGEDYIPNRENLLDIGDGLLMREPPPSLVSPSLGSSFISGSDHLSLRVLDPEP